MCFELTSLHRLRSLATLITMSLAHYLNNTCICFARTWDCSCALKQARPVNFVYVQGLAALSCRSRAYSEWCIRDILAMKCGSPADRGEVGARGPKRAAGLRRHFRPSTFSSQNAPPPRTRNTWDN